MEERAASARWCELVLEPFTAGDQRSDSFPERYVGGLELAVSALNAQENLQFSMDFPQTHAIQDSVSFVSEPEARNRPVPEEVFGGAGGESTVLDIGLLCQIFGALDRRYHSLDGQKRGQIGSV